MVIPISQHGLLGQTAAAGQTASQDVPVFEKVASWPTLPDKWRFGNLSQVWVDAQDHVWVLHRPRTLPRAVPRDGRSASTGVRCRRHIHPGLGRAVGGVRRLGRAPEEAYDWPENEHGITVDGNGNVWISGNGCQERGYTANRAVSDDMLLKFTRDGKFVSRLAAATRAAATAIGRTCACRRSSRCSRGRTRSSSPTGTATGA
jgi:hypothetical protein